MPAEQKKNPSSSKYSYTEEHAVSIPFSEGEQLTNHQKRQLTDISTAILRLLSFLSNNSEVLNSTPGCLLYDFFLQL